MFVGLMVLAALATITAALRPGFNWHPYQAVTLIVIAAVTSRMRVRIPGINGCMSVNLPFLLIAVISLSPLEAILTAGISAVVQTVPWDGTPLKPIQMIFNASMMTFASGAASLLVRQRTLDGWSKSPILLVAMSAVFFLGQTLPVSTIISLTDGGSLVSIWAGLVKLMFPYYVLSAGVASMVRAFDQHASLIAGLLLLGVMYGIYRSYQAYFAKAEPAPRPAAMAQAAASGR